MTRLDRSRLIALGLTAAAYVLALVQRPGEVVADTKVHLYVEPARFLADVASAWTPTGQLGHVFGGQYGGYLFPMAPWFAAGDALGVPVWLVHRLWLGTVFALAAYGVVRLMDALWAERPRGPVHVAAAVLYVLNPYVAVYANRTSVALLAYAALPWLLLAVHRGLREPRAWRWPALFALVLTCTGGGVNAATTAWILLGPLLFVAYERLAGGVPRGALAPFAVRLIPVAALANVWWVLPVLVHARYGLDFLPFTEQPGTIWQTTSVTESLRLVGFWTSYIGVGFGGELRPFASHGHALLFHLPVVLAGLAVSGLTLLGFAWTRRCRYGPWFLLLALAGLLVMVAGFPEGTPLRKALTFTYNRVDAVQFLRTTYKAGPLLALGLAGLGGAAFGLAWQRARWVAAVPAALLVALAAWPLTSGRAPERQLAFDVPAYWQDAADEVDRLPENERALVLPGRLFAFYDWGGTIDPILPALAERPVAERSIVPYADLRAIDLHWAVDDLVQQERALPGQLPPLADLLGAGAVVTNTDGDRTRSGEVGPLEAAQALSDGGLPRAARAHGPQRTERPAPDRIAPERALPPVRLASTRTGGVVRLLPRDDLTVLDGGGQGVTALAGFGALDPDAPLAYAADLEPAEIRRAHEVVITDTNRRQAFVSARVRANRGSVLAASDDVSEDGTMLDPFAAGPDAQTVAQYRGIRALEAPFSPQITQFPEHRPFAAVDGRLGTAWLADRALARSRHWIEVRLDRPRAIRHVDVVPYSDAFGRTRRIEVNGRQVAVRRGMNRVPVEGVVDRVRVRIVDVSQPKGRSGGAGGIRELRIPGVEAEEALRPPVVAERALGPAFQGGVTYLFARQTVDAPLRSVDAEGGFQSYRLRDRADAERDLVRTIAPPFARNWTFDAWTSVDPDGAESGIDRMAGVRGTTQASSSGPYGGIPRYRASSAFDGDRRRAWIGAGRRGTWLSVLVSRQVTVRRLRLLAPRERVRVPTRVEVSVDGRRGIELDVGPGGDLVLPAPLRGRRFSIVVRDARFPAATPAHLRSRRAVGIAEVEGIPGARMQVPRAGRLRGRCGDARAVTAAGIVPLRAVGEVADLDAARPVRAVGCRVVALRAGAQDVRGESAVLRVDHLRMRSELDGGRPASGAPGRVVDPGDGGRGERDGVRVDVRAPAWLVLGESYNRGWRAECDGRDLGAPEPLQGYANGWRVEPGCRDVRFTFAPNRLLPPAYAISLLACLALVAILLAGARRRRPAPEPLGPIPDDRAAPWPLRRALAAGALAAVVVGFVFAIRAGVVLGPALALILWRGIPTRALVLVAGGLLLVVVPLLYVAVPVDDPGGYNTNVAVERIAAHWVGVGAVFLLSTAMVRAVAAARSGSSGRRSSRTTAAAPAAGPSS